MSCPVEEKMSSLDFPRSKSSIPPSLGSTRPSPSLRLVINPRTSIQSILQTLTSIMPSSKNPYQKPLDTLMWTLYLINNCMSSYNTRLKTVMDTMFFSYFSHFFLPCFMHLCSFHRLSCFLHAAIILSHRHFIIFLLMRLMETTLDLVPCTDSIFSCSSPSYTWLCFHFCLLLFYAMAMPQPL